MKKAIYSLFIVITVISIGIFSVIYYYNRNLSDVYYKNKNSDLKIDTVFSITTDCENIRAVDNQTNNNSVISEDISLKLFNIFPIKNITVQNTDDITLIPGGEVFGLKVNIEGVIVVGTGTVDTSLGEISPSDESGIEIGDIIKKINGNEIYSSTDLEDYILLSDGEPITLEISDNSATRTVSLTPAYSQTKQCYEAGLWVRDSTAGIGTITFYDTENNYFGSLGHPVCDSDTGEFLPFAKGETSDVTISGIIKGRSGLAGALEAVFESTQSLGKIYENTQCGVFGEIDNNFSIDKEAVSIGYKQEITTGKAEIYCTVGTNGVESYEIEIEKIDYNSKEDTKNMSIRVTDERLLEQTGGIVQGMSGSPIIQNGKIIGAVTHVLLNDPERGFGIFCENMLNAVKNAY
jgi:stage IV sporulation protein B